MEIFWEELTSGLPDTPQLARLLIRLLAATLLGAVIGFERERAGKPAGLRTHILVTVGSTVFVVACASVAMSSADVSRVIQGVATGIGFIGAGAILKLTDARDIQGLTTAAGLWMTAAIGVAVGLGSLGVAGLSTVLTLLVLAAVGALENRVDKGRAATAEDRHPPAGAPTARDRGATKDTVNTP
jgi:putative Mg2+ transporter-C (MgtC) family protein